MKMRIAAVGVFGLTLGFFSQEGFSQSAAVWGRPVSSEKSGPIACTRPKDMIKESKFPDCVPEREFVMAPENSGGAYLRVHPNGTHLIVSNPARIWDISKRDDKGAIQIKSLNVPLSDESYPVEGDWKLIASPNHDNGMRYYQLDELESGNEKVSQAFNDEEHNQFYHSIAELPGSSDSKLKFRTVLYTKQKFRDYSVKKDSKGRYTQVKRGKGGFLCSSIRGNGEIDIIKIRKQYEEVAAKIKRMAFESPRGADFDQRQAALTNEYFRLQGIADAAGLESIVTPVISKDGTELVGTLGNPPTTKVLKILNDSDCEVVEDLGFQTSKAMFSYPEKGKKGKIVFTSQTFNIGRSDDGQNIQRVFVYDRDTRTTKAISEESEAFGSYPSMTRDGRVMYLSKNNGCAGLTVVDLNQLPGGDPKKCAKLGSSVVAPAATSKSGDTIQ